MGLRLMPSHAVLGASGAAKKLAQVLVGCVLLVLMHAAIANSDIALSAASPRIMPLAQGEDRAFVVRVTNHGPDPVVTVTVATIASSLFDAWYPFAMPVQNGCEGLFPGFPFAPSGLIRGYYVTLGPLAVGQHQDCRFTVHRVLAAVNDGGYRWLTDGENDAVPRNDAITFVM